MALCVSKVAMVSNRSTTGNSSGLGRGVAKNIGGIGIPVSQEPRYSRGVFIATLIDASSGIQVVVAERW